VVELEGKLKVWHDHDDAMFERAEQAEAALATFADIGVERDNALVAYQDIKKQLAAQTAALERMRGALEAILRRVPIMGSTGEYRAGQEHALEACRIVAKQALADTQGKG
jgi:hypothetical protein